MTSIYGEMTWLLGGVLAVLIVATAVGQALRRRACSDHGQARVANLNARIRAWWVMCALLGATLLTGGWLSVALFAVASFLALREFLALASARAADHGALLWCFYVIVPLQFLLVAGGWFPIFSILIPVVAFLIIPTRNGLNGDCERFLERTA